MPIEGPLRELGIHDVFQLLDLSRKTGTLHVRSTLRDNEGTMFFGEGRVIYASIKSNPHPLGELLIRTGKVTEADVDRAVAMQRENYGSRRLGDILVEIGAVSQRELDRQMRFQVEEVVFELMSWNEGFFSFEEGAADDFLPEATVSISTESLLMEGARRIDEWSRIATRIPDLSLVAQLADIPGERPPQLDLLPNEWEVLSMVDGQRSVRLIAHDLGRSDFEVARIVYGLACTGVVQVARIGAAGTASPADEIARGEIIMDRGDSKARLDRARSRGRDGNAAEAIEDLKLLLVGNPSDPKLHLELGFAHARAGILDDAVKCWTRYLELDPRGAAARVVREAVDHAGLLRTAVEEHYNG